MINFEVVEKKGLKDVAFVYLLRSKKDRNVFIECVESLDPPLPPSEKWVITLSSQKGCPVGCVFCDACYYYKGNLSKEELFDQFNLLIENYGNDNYLKSKKIKLHLARMGEPSFNDNVIDFLQEIGKLYDKLNLIPSIATVGPKGREKWFEKLKRIKEEFFSKGRFQLQFSINTTDEEQRKAMMPIRKLSFTEISKFGEFWLSEKDRLITLNFALSKDALFEGETLANYFSPQKFLIKITPLNPNSKSKINNSLIGYEGPILSSIQREIDFLEERGFKVILSIGSKKEIEIGSNCGQIAFLRTTEKTHNIY